MNTQEIANQLVEFCRQGNYGAAHDALYADNVVSIEPKGAPVEVVEGIEAVRQKGAQWAGMIQEMHGSEVGDPIVAGNHFSLSMVIDVTYKGQERSKMEEICVYETANGKIVKEQFFYPTQQA